MTTVVGVVGLGVMGSRIAGRLLDSECTLVATNRTRARAAPLVKRGLVWCDTPRQVASAADVVLSSVTDDAALEAVATGEDGILAGLSPGTVYADMSTVSPQLSQRLAERVSGLGAEMLDAPVSGSVPQAEAGELTIMVGGSQSAYERILPVLGQLGSVVRVGQNGQGLLLKLAINISLAQQMIAFGESVLLAERGGIDRQLAVDVMVASAIGSPLLRGRAPLVVDPPEQVWFDIRMMQKDLLLALDTARHLGVPLPTTAAANDFLTLARALGYERRDVASTHDVLADLADGL
ncbi:MAG TPA: NAD(P)-dependent oxidoreductase [Acidimicrobiia bacterium]|nr:NAD(P)-dependent oxidoreductase [Acidimicrobiia bacterium]